MNEINVRNAKEIYSTWHDTSCFNELCPTPKVISVLEVFEETKLAAISAHNNYLAVISGTETEKEVLVIIYLKEKRTEAFKSFPYSVCVIYFIPNCENVLLVGSSCGRIFHFNMESKASQILEGHHNSPHYISLRAKSDLLITWNHIEVLLWSWPDCLLTRRLKVDPDNVVMEGGHIWEKSYIFVAFDSGIILIWDQQQNMKQYTIEPPDEIMMKFNSFSLSLDGDWILGVGAKSFIIIYSVASLRVAQVIHLSCPESLLGINQVQFLPYIYPQFPKVYLLRTSNCLIVIDFINSSVVKLLKSPSHSISSVCVSGDGFLLAVVYGNGCTKLYTLPSFFPKPATSLKAIEKNVEVGFSIIKLADGQKERNKNKTALLFDETKWKDILGEFEEFPAKYRKHIWISLLKVPRNFSILTDILCKEKRYKFDLLENEFPQLNSTTLEILKSTLECLCYWSPFLAETEFLPHFALPFVEFFESDLLFCFEAILTIVLNWCRLWFRNWPQPPEIILNLVDQLICEQDGDLWIHLRGIGVSAEKYAWPLLTSAFRKIFTKKDWLVIWDHILSQPPCFLVCVCAAFILSLRQTLLKCSQESHAKELFSQETWIPVRTVVKRAKQLHTSLKLEVDDDKEKLETLRFLPKGGLLPFDIGPETELSLPENHNFLWTTSHSVIDLKAAFGPKAKEAMFHNLSPKRRNNSDKSRKYASKASFPADGTVIEPEQFNQLEDDCLRNIQRTRRKLISRTE